MGFCWALVNGFSQIGGADSVVFYDLPQHRPFWATVQELDVPFYLHPRPPLATRQQAYEGDPWLAASVWGFAVETSIHALRLMASGLFNEYPKLRVILGHLGEKLSFAIWRVGAAWKSKPSWYIVAKNDRTIQPDCERFLAKRMGATTVETASSHVVMLSQPQVVIDVDPESSERRSGSGGNSLKLGSFLQPSTRPPLKSFAIIGRAPGIYQRDRFDPHQVLSYNPCKSGLGDNSQGQNNNKR